MGSITEESINTGEHAWPSSGLEGVDHCPVCGSARRERLYSGLTDRVFGCAPGCWDLYRCAGCHSAYLNPRPTSDTIHLAYEHYYTHQQPELKATEDLSRLRRVIRSLANGYVNKRYNCDLQPANALGPYLISLLSRYRQALDRRLRYLPPLKPGGRLLDVGFGSGAFLIQAQRVGWQVSGSDPDPVSVGNATELGLDVREGDIEAFRDEQEQFDVITLGHVIEHVHDPVNTLKSVHSLLKPGGLLYIETPNIRAYGHEHFKEHWRGLEIPRHLVIFNWESMIQALEDVGFSDITEIQIPTPYTNLAGQSRALRNGKDPYRDAKRTPIDRLIGMWLTFPFLSDRRKTEFITLYAHKPGLT